MMFRPATSLLCSSEWCALVDALARPALAARRARQRVGDDAGQVPLERQLDRARSSDRGPARAGRSCCFFGRCPSGGVRVGQAMVAPPGGGAALERRRARRWSRFSTSRQPSTRPSSLWACSESMPSTRFASAMSASRKSIRLFLRASAARSLLVSVAGWFESLGAEQVHALHQRVVDLPGVLDRLDRVAVQRVARLALAVRDVALAEPDVVGVGVRARADVQAGERQRGERRHAPCSGWRS